MTKKRCGTIWFVIFKKITNIKKNYFLKLCLDGMR
jgi:hypothetical protein